MYAIKTERFGHAHYLIRKSFRNCFLCSDCYFLLYFHCILFRNKLLTCKKRVPPWFQLDWSSVHSLWYFCHISLVHYAHSRRYNRSPTTCVQISLSSFKTMQEPYTPLNLLADAVLLHKQKEPYFFLAFDWLIIVKSTEIHGKRSIFALDRFRASSLFMKYVDHQSLIAIILTSRPGRDKWRPVLDSTTFSRQRRQ